MDEDTTTKIIVAVIQPKSEYAAKVQSPTKIENIRENRKKTTISKENDAEFERCDLRRKTAKTTLGYYHWKREERRQPDYGIWSKEKKMEEVDRGDLFIWGHWNNKRPRQETMGNKVPKK